MDLVENKWLLMIVRWHLWNNRNNQDIKASWDMLCCSSEIAWINGIQLKIVTTNVILQTIIIFPNGIQLKIVATLTGKIWSRDQGIGKCKMRVFTMHQTWRIIDAAFVQLMECLFRLSWVGSKACERIWAPKTNLFNKY